MKVRAKCNINHDGKWRRCGDVFEVSVTEEAILRGAVEVLPIKETSEQEDETLPKRRGGRPKKTDESKE